LSIQAKKLEGDYSEKECPAKVEKNSEQPNHKSKSAAKSNSTKGKGEKDGAKRKEANSATSAAKKQKTTNNAAVAGDVERNKPTIVSGDKKKALPASLAASANLMASFLKKANHLADGKPKAAPSKAKLATTVDA
jgi:hypothetical protein